jgi:hypothetical protein
MHSDWGTAVTASRDRQILQHTQHQLPADDCTTPDGRCTELLQHTLSAPALAWSMKLPTGLFPPAAPAALSFAAPACTTSTSRSDFKPDASAAAVACLHTDRLQATAVLKAVGAWCPLTSGSSSRCSPSDSSGRHETDRRRTWFRTLSRGPALAASGDSAMVAAATAASAFLATSPTGSCTLRGATGKT